MGKTVIISGATGFLGRRICAGAASLGYRVAGLSRNAASRSALPGLTLFGTGDTGLKSAFSLPGGIAAVIHAATNYGRDGSSRAEMEKANLEFPNRLLELAAEHGAGCFINADTALPAINDYGRTKAEFASRARRAHGAVQFFNLRLQRMYGPGERRDGFAAWLILRLLAGEPEIPLTPGGQRCDFLYVDDAARAFLAILEQRGKLGGGFVDADVGTGLPVSVREFAETAKRLCGSQSSLAFGRLPYRKGEPMFLSADSSLLRSIGWGASVGIEEGLKMTISAIRNGDV